MRRQSNSYVRKIDKTFINDVFNSKHLSILTSIIYLDHDKLYHHKVLMI